MEAFMRRLPIQTVFIAITVLSGCKGKEPAPAAGGAGNLLRVTAADFTFQAPDTVQAGVTTIRLVNNGPSAHHIQFVKLDQGKTLADLLEAMKQPGPPPPWATFVGGPNGTMPGDSTTAILSLDPGSYAMICLIPGAGGVPHFAMGMTRALTAVGPAVAGSEPAATDTMRLADYSFQFPSNVPAGHHTIRVENAGPQPHEMVLVRLAPGVTATDWLKWADQLIAPPPNTQVGPPPSPVMGGMTVIMPGAHGFFVTDLTPGDYALFCFVPDMKDGKAHADHGMVSTFKVS
jgi:uncharacterized cupredoxin-like copper-binding protein